MIQPAPTTFILTIPEVGPFEIKRRTLKVQMAIHAELNRLTEGAPLASLADWFVDVCALIAELRVLIVTAPPGWSLDDIDPLEDGYASLRRIQSAIQEQERLFRTDAGRPQAPGARPGEKPAMVVSEPVSAPTA